MVAEPTPSPSPSQVVGGGIGPADQTQSATGLSQYGDAAGTEVAEGLPPADDFNDLTDRGAAEDVRPASGRLVWRVLEFSLAAVAIVSALAAFYLRRTWRNR